MGRRGGQLSRGEVRRPCGPASSAGPGPAGRGSLRDGDTAEGRERLRSLIADHPDDQVAAHRMLGQSFVEAARSILDRGITLANQRGDWHAAGEMEGLRGQLA